jgi:hypothetical protein
MRNKTVLRLEERLRRNQVLTQRLESELYAARKMDARRQRKDWDDQCYALGMAVEGAMGGYWPSDRGQAFLDFLARIFGGVDLAIAIRGISIPGPLPPKSLHARRFRWGIAIIKMIEGGQMPPAQVAELARRFLDARRQRAALNGISDAVARSSPVANESPPSQPAEAANTQAGGRQELVALSQEQASAQSQSRSPSLRGSLYVLGQFLGLAAAYSVDNRRPYLDLCRQLTDEYYDKGEAVGRMGWDWLEAGHPLEISWRDAAHLAWGRAISNHIRMRPQLTQGLLQLAGQVLDEPFRSTAMSAIEDVHENVTRN